MPPFGLSDTNIEHAHAEGIHVASVIINPLPLSLRACTMLCDCAHLHMRAVREINASLRLSTDRNLFMHVIFRFIKLRCVTLCYSIFVVVLHDAVYASACYLVYVDDVCRVCWRWKYSVCLRL
jgi:hypothetical protein